MNWTRQPKISSPSQRFVSPKNHEGVVIAISATRDGSPPRAVSSPPNGRPNTRATSLSRNVSPPRAVLPPPYVRPNVSAFRCGLLPHDVSSIPRSSSPTSFSAEFACLSPNYESDGERVIISRLDPPETTLQQSVYEPATTPTYAINLGGINKG